MALKKIHVTHIYHVEIDFAPYGKGLNINKLQELISMFLRFLPNKIVKIGRMKPVRVSDSGSIEHYE